MNEIENLFLGSTPLSEARWTTKGPYEAPALIFEQSSGLVGISAQWNMPAGLSHEEVERLSYPDISSLFTCEHQGGNFDPAAYRRLVTLFDKLLLLNPALEFIRFAKRRGITLADAVMGITSQFNLDDLIYFLISDKSAGWRDNLFLRHRNIEQCIGTNMYWFPSNATISKIEGQIRDHAVYGNLASKISEADQSEARQYGVIPSGVGHSGVLHARAESPQSPTRIVFHFPTPKS